MKQIILDSGKRYGHLVVEGQCGFVQRGGRKKVLYSVFCDCSPTTVRQMVSDTIRRVDGGSAQCVDCAKKASRASTGRMFRR